METLLGRQVKQLRKTDTVPPRVSIYDVIAAVTGMDGNHAGKVYRDLVADFPEVHSVGVNFKFPGRGQRETPVTDARGIIEVIMLLPGRHAPWTESAMQTKTKRYDVRASRAPERRCFQRHPPRPAAPAENGNPRDGRGHILQAREHG